MPGAVLVAIQEKKRTDLRTETRSIRARPTVTLKVLRAFLGRVNFIAGLVVYLRAIVTWLWHAVNAREDEASRPRPQAAGGRKLSRQTGSTRGGYFAL